jgi:transcriptional regulator with XRE-family HTH domain
VKRATAADQFGRAVRRSRQSRGLTQHQLAIRVGDLSASYISNVEGGRKNLTLSQCERIARALKIPIEIVFFHSLPTR